MIAGGVKAIELTFTVPNAADLVAILVKEYAGHANVLIGAGTVLSDFQVYQAIIAGTKFIVQPSFSTKIEDISNVSSINYILGCFTLNEVYPPKESDVTLTKFFPTSLVGHGVIRELHGLFPKRD